MGLLTDYITDRHNRQLAQQKTVLDNYAGPAGGDNADSEVNHIAFERHMKYSGMPLKKFSDPKILQQMMDDNKMFEEMNAKARGRQQQAPPPTQSLASQGPPSAQAMQVPPPPGGTNYGQFAAPQPLPNALGQSVAPSQSVPPPPGMNDMQQAAPIASPQGVDTSAVPLFRDISPTRALDRKGFTDEALKYGAQYGAQYGAMGREKEVENKAEFERMKAISAFNRQENEALMNRMKKEGGGGHIYSEIGVNGAPSLKLDPGTLSSRPVAGKDLLDSNPDMTDKYGKPIDPLKFYDRRQYTRAGGEELMPTSVPPIVRVETPDPTHPETRMIVARDRQGTVIYQEPYAPNAAFAPLVRSSTTERMLNLGDKIISVPATTTNRSQRVLPGQPVVAPPPEAGGAPSPAPTVQPRSNAPRSSIPAGAGRSWQKNLSPTQVLPMKNSIEVGAHQLWGDPDNPSLRPLASYANLADDQGARQRLGQALRMVLDAGGDTGAEHLGASAGPVSFSAGNLGTALSYNLGIPQAAADAKATALRDIFAKMKPEEVDYFNSLMNAIPTITGFRKLTSGGAFRWSQQGLERELPMIGLSGVTNSATFSKKMAALGDEPLTAIKNLERTNPGVVDPRLTVLIQGGGRGVAPSGPPGSKPTNAVEFMQKYGIKPQ